MKRGLVAPRRFLWRFRDGSTKMSQTSEPKMAEPSIARILEETTERCRNLDAPLAGRQPVQAQTRGDRVKPRRELRLAAELADGAVDAQKYLLGEILGFRPVPQHPERHAEDAVLMGDHQVLERPGVAAPEPLHQARIIAGTPFHAVRPYRPPPVPPHSNSTAGGGIYFHGRPPTCSNPCRTTVYDISLIPRTLAVTYGYADHTVTMGKR